MSIPYITIGCPTTGGGRVLTGNSCFLIEGIPVACVGDTASCPTHKTTAIIVSGDPHMNVFGKAAARVNDSLSCGCKLLPKQYLVVGDNGGTYSGMMGAMVSSIIKDSSGTFSAKFKMQIDDDTPLCNIPFIAMVGDEIIYKGTTDDEGFTDLVKTEQAERVHIKIDVDRL